MSIYALIVGGINTNNVIADPSYVSVLQTFCDTVVDITDVQPQPQIGWLYDGVKLTPASESIPESMPESMPESPPS